MKKFICLFAIISFCFTSCDNEPLDDLLLDSTFNPVTGPGNLSLVGDWDLVSLDYTGTQTSNGVTVDYVGTSLNENYTITFTQNGSFGTIGGYDINLDYTILNITQNTVVNVSGGQGGTYSATQSVITTDTAFFSFSVDGQPASPVTTPGTQDTDYTISADGQTLTLTSDYNETVNVNGITVTLSFSAISILVKNNSGGGSNPTSIDGTWLLTAWNAADAFDLNNDGTATTSVLDEMNCYTNETLVLNSDNTGTSVSTSYAEISVDVVVGTTNQFTYTVNCIQDNDTTNLTWSQNGNTVSLTDSFGTTDWTLSGNTLSITVPDGFVVFESDGATVSTTSDLTFVYTKQ